MDFQLVALHVRRDLIEGCANILVEQWPKGKYNRLQEIESSLNPPCSLAFISKQLPDIVVGHCRIIPVKDDKHALYVESVVIGKHSRGKRLGRQLMLEIEIYARGLGYETLYLDSSPDTFRFYLKLGYSFTEKWPTVVGSQMLDAETQVPDSEPFPGFEHYYRPYDGSKLDTFKDSKEIVLPYSLRDSCQR